MYSFNVNGVTNMKSEDRNDKLTRIITHNGSCEENGYYIHIDTNNNPEWITKQYFRAGDEFPGDGRWILVDE